MRSLTFLTTLACVAVSAASPVAGPEITPAPEPALAKRASCTFSGSAGAASASKSQASCATIVLSDVAVPSGTTLDLSDLEDGTTVIFEGETTWGYEEWDGPLLQIEGNEITIEGASGAYLNPDGARWWDGEGSNGGKTKPKFFYAHDLTSSTITNLYIQNTPVQAVSINGCDGLTITDMTIDNSAGDTDALGHNTDITFTGGVCSGGHGLSIGSVGGRSDNDVDTVTFSNSEVKNSVNGIRIKASSGDTGTITGVTYSGITLSAISKYGIIIEQNYDGGDLDGTTTTGIPITNLKVEDIAGSGAVASSGYDVVITCGSGSCSSWTWSDVVVTGGETYGSCTNVPSVASCSA
ncbi:hypothetical protein LQW54_008519 [Pestalotiopsis sp. IQ-011]